MGRRNAKVSVATWEVKTYLLAEEPLLRYLDSGVDSEAWEKYLSWLKPEDIRRSVVALFKAIRMGAKDYEGYYELSFNPDLAHFFWFTHRFVFDREHPGKVNHPLESMGLPYYVALWGLVERIRIWNNTAVRIEYEAPSAL
jgi:hypothetical protein